ncbi:MAG: hypothetical protein HC888_11950 [Candidatus Competibacteraceae bacterium]|nr:hypothetical protein [Candidatus Competibacteraceae bacterium]
MTGKVTHYETRIPQTNPRNPNPWQVEKRVDVVGDPHYNKVLKQDFPRRMSTTLRRLEVSALPCLVNCRNKPMRTDNLTWAAGMV